MMQSETFSHSIICNNKTAIKFLRTFGFDSSDSEKVSVTLVQRIEEILSKYEGSIECLKKDYPQDYFNEQYQIGEKIRVSYYPDSQKYIDYYDKQEFVGIIFFTDPEQDNMFMFSKLDGIIRTQSLEREGCHYFGMSKSYTYFIDSDF